MQERGKHMIGIIAAMQAEARELQAIMENVEHRKISNIHFFIGQLQGKDVVLMQSGVGKGNAAMTASVMLEHFDLRHVINIGTAGGLRDEENILDIVVGDMVVQHDFDTSGVDGDDGIGLYFKSDERLRDICASVLKEMGKPYHIGMVASGDQFIHSDEQVYRVKEMFPDVICAEMEAGAIAQVCSFYEVPFIVLRSLSDIALKEDSHMDFLEYTVHASKASAQICERIVAHI